MTSICCSRYRQYSAHCTSIARAAGINCYNMIYLSRATMWNRPIFRGLNRTIVVVVFEAIHLFSKVFNLKVGESHRKEAIDHTLNRRMRTKRKQISRLKIVANLTKTWFNASSSLNHIYRPRAISVFFCRFIRWEIFSRIVTLASRAGRGRKSGHIVGGQDMTILSMLPNTVICAGFRYQQVTTLCGLRWFWCNTTGYKRKAVLLWCRAGTRSFRYGFVKLTGKQKENWTVEKVSRMFTVLSFNSNHNL